jgi:hypothetical protein
MATLLSRGTKNFHPSMNSSVSAFSEEVASPISWKSYNKVTAYNVYAPGSGRVTSHNIKSSLVSMGEEKKFVRNVGKKTKFGQLDLSEHRRETSVSGYIYDEVTPKLVELENWFRHIAAMQGADALKKGITHGVKKKYRSRNDGTWPKNSKKWRAYKKQAGFDTRPMHMRDTQMVSTTSKWQGGTKIGQRPLADVVKGFGDKLRVEAVNEKTYKIEGLDEEFEDNGYVWFHEGGYAVRGIFEGSYVPPRPFVAPGVNEGTAYAMGTLMNRNPLNRKQKGITYSDSVGYTVKKKKSSMELWMLIWWFMPQISEWQYLAYMHDGLGYLSGHFISSDTIKHFASALVAGKAGQISGIPMTTKLARRSSRETLWGTQQVSIFGGT